VCGLTSVDGPRLLVGQRIKQLQHRAGAILGVTLTSTITPTASVTQARSGSRRAPHRRAAAAWRSGARPPRAVGIALAQPTPGVPDAARLLDIRTAFGSRVLRSLTVTRISQVRRIAAVVDSLPFAGGLKGIAIPCPFICRPTSWKTPARLTWCST
jgi:hypothetical protein